MFLNGLDSFLSNLFMNHSDLCRVLSLGVHLLTPLTSALCCRRVYICGTSMTRVLFRSSAASRRDSTPSIPASGAAAKTL